MTLANQRLCNWLSLMIAQGSTDMTVTKGMMLLGLHWWVMGLIQLFIWYMRLCHSVPAALGPHSSRVTQLGFSEDCLPMKVLKVGLVFELQQKLSWLYYFNQSCLIDKILYCQFICLAWEQGNSRRLCVLYVNT